MPTRDLRNNQVEPLASESTSTSTPDPSLQIVKRKQRNTKETPNTTNSTNTTHTIVSGDILSRIAKDNGVTLEGLLAVNPGISNPNNVPIGQVVNIPRPDGISSTITQELVQAEQEYRQKRQKARPKDNVSSVYSVIKGDNLSKIARAHNVSVQTILQNNPDIRDANQIEIGQEIKIPTNPSNQRTIPMNFSTIQKREEEINQMSDVDIINHYHKTQKTGKAYMIDDKANGRTSVYRNGQLIKSYVSVHGKAADLDDMTITYVDKKTKEIIDGAGNMSTPAGVYKLVPSGRYYGAPAFMRQLPIQFAKKMEDGIPSSVHVRNVRDGSKFKTNGCTGMAACDLRDMAKYIKEPTESYILPVEEGNRFYLRNGELQFRTNNVAETPAHNTMNYAPATSILSNKHRNLTEHQQEVAAAFVKSLADNKVAIQQATGLNNDSYIQLAKVAYGMLGAESTFGKENSALENVGKFLGKATGLHSTSPDIYSKHDTYEPVLRFLGQSTNNRSVGLTQIRMTQLSKEDKKLLKQFRIHRHSLVNSPEKAAIATMIKLATAYKNHGHNIERALSKEWNSGVHYQDIVNDYSRDLEFNQDYPVTEEEYNKYWGGGRQLHQHSRKEVLLW